MGLVELIEHGRPGIAAHVARAQLVNALAGWNHFPVLGHHFEAGAAAELFGNLHGIFGHREFVIGVFLLDVQNRNSPGVLDIPIDAHVVLETRQHGAHGGHAETYAADFRKLLLERLAGKWKVTGIGGASRTEVVSISTAASLRTAELGTMVKLPVASASGSNRFTELANCPVASRDFVVGTFIRLADAIKRRTHSLSGESSAMKTPSGICANPSRRPATRNS